MLLCRSVFSDQPKTHACLRVRQALSVSLRGEGEGACDISIYVCMCMCVCVERQGQQGGSWRAAKWRLHGQLRDWPLSGHPSASMMHLKTVLHRLLQAR